MFGFGKKVAHSEAVVSALIQVTCAYWNEYKEMPGPGTLESDVPIFIDHFGGKMTADQKSLLGEAANVIYLNLDGLGDDCKNIGIPANVSDQDIEKVTQKLRKHGISFD